MTYLKQLQKIIYLQARMKLEKLNSIQLLKLEMTCLKQQLKKFYLEVLMKLEKLYSFKQMKLEMIYLRQLLKIIYLLVLKLEKFGFIQQMKLEITYLRQQLKIIYFEVLIKLMKLNYFQQIKLQLKFLLIFKSEFQMRELFMECLRVKEKYLGLILQNSQLVFSLMKEYQQHFYNLVNSYPYLLHLFNQAHRQ